MKIATDILFVTYMEIPRDTGDPSVYKPLRLHLEDVPAVIPLLRKLAADEGNPRGASARPAPLGVPPVLTPIYLQEYARKRGFTFLDVPCLEVAMDPVAKILASGVGLIALSTTWLPHPGGADVLRKAASALRVMAPDLPIIAGGVGVRKGLVARERMEEGRLPGVSREDIAHDYLLIDPHLDGVLDAIVTCEGGEATMIEIAQRLREGKDFRDVANLAFPEDGNYRFTTSQSEQVDLDKETVDWREQKHRLGVFDAPIRGSVGCPFRCGFCDFTSLYQPGQRSLESLIAELRTLAEAVPPPRRVYFIDDNVAVTRTRLRDFSRAIIAAKLDISWRGFMRADAVDQETAELLRASGCRECALGIESGDAQILKNMNKRLDPDRALRTIELLDAQGINTQCTFVVGFPGESAASVERTAAFISAFPSGSKAGGIHRYYLFRFQVLPLSPIATPEKREEYGLAGVGEHWLHRTMNADEAKDAVRELFLKVQGPSHAYIELLPPEWPIAATRQVLEQRDIVQKERLRGMAGEILPLMVAVRSAESQARTTT